MSTDTKAVARWEIGFKGLSDKAEMLEHYRGRYVLFADYGQMVTDLRDALAASRAEVEGLKDMIRAMQNNSEFDFDAAMEKGNV